MLIFSLLLTSFSEDFKEVFNVYTKHQNEVIKTSYVNVYLKPFKCTPFIFFKPITSCVHSLARHQNEASAHVQKPQMGESFHLQNVTQQNWCLQNKFVPVKETVQLSQLLHSHGHSKD